MIGTVRRELLDQTFFWTEIDLQKKLDDFQRYFNEERCHLGIEGMQPNQKSGAEDNNVISINNYRWKKHCRGLFEFPIAA